GPYAGTSKSPAFAVETEQIAKPASPSPNTVWRTSVLRVARDMVLSLLVGDRTSCHVRLASMVPSLLRRFGVIRRVKLGHMTEQAPPTCVGGRTPSPREGTRLTTFRE